MNSYKNLKSMSIIVIIGCLLLTACKETKSTSTKTEATSTGLTPKSQITIDNMTYQQYEQITNDTVNFALSIANFYDQQANLCKKYADEITLAENLSQTFNWSQYWDFRELKSNVCAECERFLQYDDSQCSYEFRLLISESKSIAYEILHYFAMISEERTIDELDDLVNQNGIEVDIGTKRAMLYHTQATIAYLEANNGDEKKIQELKESIQDYSYSDNDFSSNLDMFTNLYGTPDTECVYPNCNNTIAFSGDTNCCIIHSNKCLNCEKYIYGDALFCMDCLEKAVEDATNSNKTLNHTASINRCQYKYFDGSVCNEIIYGRSPLCNKHFNELNDTYNYFVGK